MPYLDRNLRRVAKLRQVTIKTARDWRDSENRKWFSALEEVEELRRKTGKDIIRTEPVGFFDALAELEVESLDIQDTPEIQEAIRSVQSFTAPPL